MPEDFCPSGGIDKAIKRCREVERSGEIVCTCSDQAHLRKGMVQDCSIRKKSGSMVRSWANELKTLASASNATKDVFF